MSNNVDTNPMAKEAVDDSSKIFPQKLMEIIEDPSNNDAITWHPNGKVFVIVDRRKFCKQVLPKYFRKSKYTSFTRKLNRWNFIRLTRGRQVSTYYHEFFQRGKDALCTQMYCNNDRAKFAVSNKTSEPEGATKQDEKHRKSALTNSLAHVLPYEHEPSAEILTRSVEADLHARSALMQQQHNLMKKMCGVGESAVLPLLLSPGFDTRAALLQSQNNLMKDNLMKRNLISMALQPAVVASQPLPSHETLLRKQVLEMQQKEFGNKANNVRLQLAMLQRAQRPGFNFCSAA